jgi:hypothetical protein
MVDPVARAVAVLGVLAGCSGPGPAGGPEPICPIDALGGDTHYCRSAASLAVRTSQHLVIQQDEVDYFYELLKPAYAALPILRLAKAFVGGPSGPVLSRYPPIVEAWSAGQVRVGEARVDRWFADAGAYAVTRTPTDFDGYPTFAVGYELLISYRVLEQGLTEIPDTRLSDEDIPLRHPNVLIAWDGDDALLTFLVGWGDCFVECEGVHDYLARVTPDLEVTIEDLGGDPVPPEFQEVADNYPPPS